MYVYKYIYIYIYMCIVPARRPTAGGSAAASAAAATVSGPPRISGAERRRRGPGDIDGRSAARFRVSIRIHIWTWTRMSRRPALAHQGASGGMSGRLGSNPHIARFPIGGRGARLRAPGVRRPVSWGHIRAAP